ncbi:MAG: GrpB family protein [Caldilineaceae bacterium]
MIRISPYNPKWPEEFERIKASLHAILGDLALRIDHIGSTSVPGLGAKDVIDIQITVKALDEQIRRELSQAGYQDWGTIAHDHIPLYIAYFMAHVTSMQLMPEALGCCV